MPTVMVTFLKATYVLATFVDFSNISASTDPILTQQVVYLGQSLTYANFQGDICPGDICPYQQYLSWCRPNFDQALKLAQPQMSCGQMSP